VNRAVLFLDFDGVLHPDGEAALDENFRLLPNANLFCWLKILNEILEPHPDVQIVVSSDWRRLFDDENLVRLLGPLGGRFAGVVETLESPRSQEILGEAARRSIERWVALDDHASVHEAAKEDCRFIACDPRLGVSNPETQKALSKRLLAFWCRHPSFANRESEPEGCQVKAFIQRGGM